jgi:para-nitrobenzyl esterase
MAAPIASTSSGRLRGASAPGGLVWRGIPYATAARFEAPRPVEPWAGERDATTPGAQAPQLPSVLDQMLGPATLEQSEACLTLDVWTPPEIAPGGDPVLVWIHGGAFTNGTGAAPWYDGTAFCRAGCVLVSINYRLGAFGFLAVPELGNTAGNLGLLDQIAALRWVQGEIAAFGGDPGNVTVFGESAGGTSVVSLMTSPLAEGLFHRAWAMSPSLSQLRSAERARAVATDLVAAAGLGGGDAARLRDLPVEQLLEAQGEILRRRDPFTAFAPTPDGAVLPAAGLLAALEQSWGSSLPLVLGTTTDEMALFMAFDPQVQGLDDAGLERRAQPLFGERTPAILAAYRKALPGSPPSRIATAIATDHTFRMPATRVAEARSAATRTGDTWMYSFAWPTPVFGAILGSCHGLDIPFAFHALDGPGVALFTGTGDDRAAVADAFHGAIVAFARDGAAGWPAYELRRRAVRRFDSGTEPVVLDDPDPALHALYR